MLRIIKISLSSFVAFFCIVYALQNIVNLQAAYGYVTLITGMSGQIAYPEHIGPAVESSALIWTMLWIIIILELGAGLLAAKGSFDLWIARNTSSEEFQKAKKYALLGSGLGVIIWFGLFSAIGGAYFQMWQTEAGQGAMNGSFQYAMLMGLMLLIINSKDE